MSVRIITDSASDLSPAEHPALAVLPLSVTFGTDAVSYTHLTLPTNSLV